jgi:hypothetical protein
MSVTPPEEVLEEVPELEMVPLADNERVVQHPAAQGTRRWSFSAQFYHWIERQDEKGVWRPVMVRGIDREQQEAVLAAQRAHNEQVRANRARMEAEGRSAPQAAAQAIQESVQEAARSRLAIAKSAGDVRKALRGE